MDDTSDISSTGSESASDSYTGQIPPPPPPIDDYADIAIDDVELTLQQQQQLASDKEKLTAILNHVYDIAKIEDDSWVLEDTQVTDLTWNDIKEGRVKPSVNTGRRWNRIRTSYPIEHTSTVKVVLEKYKTSARRGLSDDQRKKRLALFGENTDMSGTLYKWTKPHGAIKQQVHDKLEAYWVLIDGEWLKRPSLSLVPGDIVLVSEGQVVPADLRIIRAWSCWLENGHATWTTARWASTSNDGNTNWLNSPNMAYQKMWINSEGYLIGIVLATGETTVANTQYYYHYPVKYAVDPEAKMFLKLAGGMNIYMRDLLGLTRLRGLQYLFMNFDILLHHKKANVASVFYNNKIHQPEEIDAADLTFIQLHRVASLVNSAHVHGNKAIGTNGFDRVIALFLERYGSVSKWRKTHERYSNTSANTFGVYLEEGEDKAENSTGTNNNNNNDNTNNNNNVNQPNAMTLSFAGRKKKKAANAVNIEGKFGAKISVQMDDAYTIISDQTVQYWLNNGVIEELDNGTRQFVQDMIKVLAERKYIMLGYSIRLVELSRNVFVGFIALDVPFKPPAVKQSIELMRSIGYKQVYYCRYNLHSIRAFMEALSFECIKYDPQDSTHWPLIGPGRAPVINNNDWDQFGLPVWNDNNNNNNNNEDQPPDGEPPNPPTDENKSEEVKKMLASKVVLFDGDLEYNQANKLLSSSILCMTISQRNYHHLTSAFTVLNTLRRPFITIGCNLADSLILSSSACKMFFSRMLGVCYYYATSELVCISQRVSDLARFMEELKKKDQYLQTHPNAVAYRDNCSIS